MRKLLIGGVAVAAAISFSTAIPTLTVAHAIPNDAPCSPAGAR
jgi:hypothetical protein